MTQHKYTYFFHANADRALRLVEEREREGWDLVSIVSVRRGFSFSQSLMVVMRRVVPPVPPDSILGLSQ
jgi:hypothetical protein